MPSSFRTRCTRWSRSRPPARATPFAIAIRSVQREAIRSDPEWRGGDYEQPGPVNGLRVARKLGLITYRSAAEWRQRFSRERVDVRGPGAGPFDVEFEIEAYLEMHAQKFVGTFDANCYLYLSRSMDLFDVAEHGGSVEAGLGRIRARSTLVIGVETDFLFPIDQQEEIAAVLEHAGRDVRFDPPALHPGPRFVPGGLRSIRTGGGPPPAIPRGGCS